MYKCLKNRSSYLALFFAGILVLSAQAHAEKSVCNEGVGGTGISDGLGGTGHADGLGGTGISARNDGLGGTGHADGLGGTGIVGVITGFASVCVNGVEAHFDSSTQVDIDGVSANINQLNIGDLVAIDAKGQGAEVSAKRISVSHIMIGRIESVNSTNRQVTIMGQTVQLSAQTQGENHLKVGQNIAVSGFASNGAVLAMRTDVVADTAPALLTGNLLNGKVIGVAVKISSNNLGGSALQVRGKWDGRALNVNEIKQNALDRVMMHEGYAFDIQGLAYQSGNEKVLYTQGKQVYIEASTKVYGDKNSPNTLAVVRGQVDTNGRAVAKAIEYRSIDRALERGGSKARPVDMLRENKPSDNKSEKDKKNQSNPEREERKAEHKVEKLDGREKLEKTDVSDKIQKPEKLEKSEKIEKLEKVEKPEKVEKVEKIEKPDHVEKPEKLEKST